MQRQFKIDFIKRCIECRGCENDCPAFKTIESYNPTLVNKDIVRGDIEKWVGEEMIWQCVECHTCSEMCPQCYSWENVFTILKSIAMKRETMPEQMAKGKKVFIESGRLGEPRESMREKLKLPKSKQTGVDDFKKMLNVKKDKNHK